MNSVLITGANRGIGLGLVKALQSHTPTPKHIIATCRKTSESEELQKLANSSQNVKIINLEVTDFESYTDFSTQVSNVVGEEGLNVLINNAGISEKFGRINMVKKDKLEESFLVNTIAPIMLTKSLLPLLKTSADKNKNLPMSSSKAAIINISSVLASISGNKEGGFYSYKCSKTALNAATKSLSVDLRSNGILVVSIHPGWVRTRMGGDKAPLSVEQAVPSILQTITGLKESHSGGFYDLLGKEIPW